MNLSDKLKNLNVAIVSHIFATGPAQDLEEYLRNKVNKLIFVGHPFYYAGDIRSFCKIYHKGELIREKKAFCWRLPEIFLYFKDAFYTLLWLYRHEQLDLYIGADSLNTFAGIMLKRMKKVKIVIFYTIDYVPQRFENIMLNRLYHWLDKFCLKNSDYVWNLSPRMAEGRKKRGINKDNVAPQLTVPEGVHFERIKRLSVEEISRYAIVFMGHIRKYQGLELLIDAMPDIIKKIPKARLLVIGTGPLEPQLKNKVGKLNLNKYVTFTGYIESSEEIDKLMATCAIGVAPYEPNPKSFTYYADPAKPKRYMACGLPVITTRVSWIGEEVEKKPMGITINYNKKELVDAVVKLLQDDDFYKKCRENTIEFVSELSWDKIYDKAFKIII